MRALCGAIITAGAMIGLGLLAVGFGWRYAAVPHVDSAGHAVTVHLHETDPAMVVCFVFLIAYALIGLGITFLGLMYHHHRRYHEHLRNFPHDTAGTPRAAV